MIQLPMLVVGSDPGLQTELQDALSPIEGLQPVMYSAGNSRQATEMARNLQPELVLLELSTDVSRLRHLVEEVKAASPNSCIAGAFRPEIFGDLSEGAFLIEAIRAGVSDFLRRPVSTGDIRQLVRRLGRNPSGESSRPQGKVVSFVSNKGGVGKSTISTNVACGLARRFPDRVLLIDASLQMGVCAVLLNLEPKTSISDCVREWDRLDETLIRQLAVVHPCGLHLLAGPADAEEAAGITEENMSRIITLARRVYDYVIIDTFPMLDRVMLAALDLSDRVYLLTDNVVPTVLGAAKLVGLFDRLGFPADRQGLILNRYDAYAGLTADDISGKVGRPVAHSVPYDRRLVPAANSGEPYVLRASRWRGFGRALGRIVDEVVALPRLSRIARDESPA